MAFVAPLVGAWIEIDDVMNFSVAVLVAPSWEHGLKYRRHLDTLASKHVILAANVLYLWQ